MFIFLSVLFFKVNEYKQNEDEDEEEKYAREEIEAILIVV